MLSLYFTHLCTSLLLNHFLQRYQQVFGQIIALEGQEVQVKEKRYGKCLQSQLLDIDILMVLQDWCLPLPILYNVFDCLCCLSRPRPCCFNCCSEDHQLRDCPKVFFFLQLLTIYVLDSNLLLHCYILKSTCGYKSNFEPFKPFNLFYIFCLSPKIWLVSMKKERSFHRTAIRATNATMQKRSRSDLQSTSQE